MSYRRKLISPAKVNLVLRIGPRRKDGFHDLASLMCKLNWGDELSLEVEQSSETEIQIECNEISIANDSNIAVRAAREFASRIPIFFRLKMKLLKRIPMEAGLGGGSANAASLLQFLSEWYLEKIGKFSSLSKLTRRIAADLGSDISFFLGAEPAAWCTGKGDHLKACRVPSFPALLVFPKAKISTAWAYRSLDQARGRTRTHLDLSIPAWAKQTGVQVPILENDFEALALESQAELRSLKADLMLSGAVAGQMTGSGSCFFGIYTSAAASLEARSFMEERGWRCQEVSIGER